MKVFGANITSFIGCLQNKNGAPSHLPNRENAPSESGSVCTCQPVVFMMFPEFFRKPVKGFAVSFLSDKTII
jgi:hypothetical protein